MAKTSPKKPAARAAAKPPKSGPPVFAIGLGLVIVLGIVAVVLTRGGSDSGGDNTGADPSVEQVRDVDVTGDALAKHGGTEDPAVGKTAPSVTGRTFDGGVVSVGGAGQPQLVVFVAHWCPHCQKEVPVITQWIDENGAPEGIELLAVSTGVNPNAPNYPPSSWLAREGWPVRTLADDAESSVAQAYGLSGYPYFVAIDANGAVVERASGELTVEQIEELIAKARS